MGEILSVTPQTSSGPTAMAIANNRLFYQAVAKSAAVVAVSLVVGLGVLEAGTRIWDGVALGTSENFVFRDFNAVLKGNAMARFDDRLGWKQAAHLITWGEDAGRKTRYTFGDLGTRMSSTEFVPPESGAVLVVGDSFAGGSEVADGDTWPAQLERMLGSRVINAAVGGYGIDQSVLRAEELLPRIKPKMVLLETNLAFGISISRLSLVSGAYKPYFFVRDGTLTLGNEPVPQHARSAEIGRLRSVLGYSYLAYFVMKRLDWLPWWIGGGLQQKYALSESEGVDVTCRLMQRLGALAAQHKINVGLVFQYGGPEGQPAPLTWEKDRARVTECAKQEGLPIADALDTLQSFYREQGEQAYQRLWVMRDNGRVYGHMSPEGNRLIAKLVHERLFHGVQESSAASLRGPQ